MRRHERATWRALADAAARIADSSNYAEEYMAKIALRKAWAKLNGIPGVSGIPRSGTRWK